MIIRFIVPVLAILILLTGCSEQTTDVITDQQTGLEMEQVSNITSDMRIIYAKNDEMDRGNHDFFDKEIVVENRYYEENQIKRGDIVSYKKDEGFTRIIALEGEKVKISNAQIYINGKRLDSFYGRGHRLGMDLNELKNKLKQGDFEEPYIEQNVKNQIEFLESINEEEIMVPKGHVYVIGDDWFRTGIMGILPKENMTGKVLGYK
ncbi:signal peptidase I [Sutcliffiella sp. NPDC057660]|uniref:signal peptidase I n=1 Tax=Sutcliffiella sp. NPDC057660 TaxID=3346199 RepID=UPI003687BF21